MVHVQDIQQVLLAPSMPSLQSSYNALDMRGDDEATANGPATDLSLPTERLARISDYLRDSSNRARTFQLDSTSGRNGVYFGFCIGMLAVLLLPRMPGFKAYLDNVHDEYYYSMICGLSAAATYALLSLLFVIKRRNRLARQIDAARLVERIGKGWESFPVIHDYAPRLALRFLGPRPKSDSDWSALITDNLAWYVSPPHRLRAWHFKGLIRNAVLFSLLSGLGLYVLLMFPLITWGGPRYMQIFESIQNASDPIMRTIGVALFTALWLWDVQTPGAYIKLLSEKLSAYAASQQAAIQPPAVSAPPATPREQLK